MQIAVHDYDTVQCSCFEPVSTNMKQQRMIHWPHKEIFYYWPNTTNDAPFSFHFFFFFVFDHIPDNDHQFDYKKKEYSLIALKDTLTNSADPNQLWHNTMFDQGSRVCIIKRKLKNSKQDHEARHFWNWKWHISKM